MSSEHVEIEVMHDKVHAQNCKTCESSKNKIDQFTQLIKLSGDLDENQRRKLLTIADKCPVHRTL